MLCAISQMTNASAPATPDVERDPEPAGEAGTGEQRDADGDRGDESAEAEQRVREAEHRALPRVRFLPHCTSGLKLQSRSASGSVEQRELVEREREGGPPAERPDDDQEDREAPRGGGARSVTSLMALIMAITDRGNPRVSARRAIIDVSRSGRARSGTNKALPGTTRAASARSVIDTHRTATHSQLRAAVRVRAP